MIIYSITEIEGQLDTLLDRVKNEGKVLIRKEDGTLFSISLETSANSPLDVAPTKTDLTTEEIIEFIRNARRR